MIPRFALTLAGRISRSPRGFTRTDLLAILAALAMGLTVSVGFLKTSHRNAGRSECLANLGKLGRAFQRFASDHQQTLPDAEPGKNEDIWWFYKEQIKGYLGLKGASSADDRGFACPADRGYADHGPFSKEARFDFTSYVYNGVTLPDVPNIAGWSLAAVRDPARTLLVMEWAAHAPLSWHDSRTGTRNAPFYCDAISVIAFVDGHSASAPIYYDGHTPAYVRDPIPGYSYKYNGN